MTSPFDTNAQPVSQRSGSFQTTQAAPVDTTNRFTKLLNSVSKYVGAGVTEHMQKRSAELQAQGSIDIAAGNVKIADLQENEFTTEAYQRGAQVMAAKGTAADAITKYHDSLNDEEVQRMNPEQMKVHLQELVAGLSGDTGTGDDEVDQMVMQQVAAQVPELLAKHTELHRKRVEEDSYLEGHNYTDKGLRQITAQVNNGSITEEQAKDLKLDVYNSAMEYMFTEDQKKALLSHSLVTTLEARDFDTYDVLYKEIDKLGGLHPKQLEAVNRAYDSMTKDVKAAATFADTVAVAELNMNAQDLAYNKQDFYNNVKEAQESGLITHKKAVSLLEQRINEEAADAKITTAADSFLNSGTGRISMLAPEDQQVALNRSFELLSTRLEGQYSGEALEAVTNAAWTQHLVHNSDVVHKQTAKRFQDSIHEVTSSTNFSDDAKNDFITMYEMSKLDKRFLANYVPDKQMQADIINYGDKMQLSPDDLQNMIQRDRLADSRPSLTQEQSAELNTLVQEYHAELENRDSKFWSTSFGARDPDNIAAAGAINELSAVAQLNLRSGLYRNPEKAFEAAQVELAKGTQQILGYTIPTGNRSLQSRMLLTDVEPDEAIARHTDRFLSEKGLKDGEKRFLSFDTLNDTVSIIKRHTDGFTEIVNTTSFIAIGKWAEDNKSTWEQVDSDYELGLLRDEQAKQKQARAAAEANLAGFKRTREEHAEAATWRPFD